MTYDAVLIHPPSFYDFRKQPIFPGPIAYTVGGSTTQFIMPPVGMLSIAEYLERGGYHARVDYLGERMLADSNLDVEEYIGQLSARSLFHRAALVRSLTGSNRNRQMISILSVNVNQFLVQVVRLEILSYYKIIIEQFTVIFKVYL